MWNLACTLSFSKCWFWCSLTGGETSLLVTFGELYVEIRNQCMDVIVTLDLQTEGWGERQVLWLHSVDVHLLSKENEKREKFFNHYLLKLQMLFLSLIREAHALFTIYACAVCVCVKAHRLNHDWQTKPARSTHAVWVSSAFIRSEVCVKSPPRGQFDFFILAS